MLARGGGYLLHTCSAAGLLVAPGDAPYTATKHAAVAYAEWLAVTYGDADLRVSALCPQGVRTPLLMAGLEAGSAAAKTVTAAGELLEPDDVAGVVVEGLAAERFLVLPHPEVSRYVQHKAADRDRWIAGARRRMG
jgi:NAD(P)-dependent dehydrogenase (short-subunit alcohol dehydrogenase family)